MVRNVITMKSYAEKAYNKVIEDMTFLKEMYYRRHLGDISIAIRNLHVALSDLQSEINELLEKYDTEDGSLIVPEHELFSK